MSSSSQIGSAVDLDRSVFVRGDLNAMDILGFIQKWKGISVLHTCRLVKKGLHELTFHSLECADQLMDLGFSIMIGEQKAELRPANNRRKKVQIHGLPGSFKEELLRRYLQDIGTLDSLVPDLYQDEFNSVHTGVWHAIITSKADPPPIIHMGEYTARLLYAGQRITCWDCNSPHPKSAKCPDPLCRNCKKSGHLAASCPLPCSICSTKHPSSKNCKFEAYLAEITAPPVPPDVFPATILAQVLSSIQSSTPTTPAVQPTPPPVCDSASWPLPGNQPTPALDRPTRIRHDLMSSTPEGFRPTKASSPKDLFARSHRTAYDRLVAIDFSLDHHLYPRQEYRALIAERAFIADYIHSTFETHH